MKIEPNSVPEALYSHVKKTVQPNEESEANNVSFWETFQNAVLKTKASIPNEKEAQVFKTKIQTGYRTLKETDDPIHAPTQDVEYLFGVDQKV